MHVLSMFTWCTYGRSQVGKLGGEKIISIQCQKPMICTQPHVVYMSDASFIVHQISKVEVYWQNQLLLFGIDTVFHKHSCHS